MAKLRVLFPICFLLLLTTCLKDKEVLKTPTRAEGEGLIVNHQSEIVNLEKATVESYKVTDTVSYENQKLPVYNIELSGEDASVVEVGDVMLSPDGNGVVMVTKVTEPAPNQRLKLLAKAVKVSLDFFFNYEGAELKVVGQNRAKRNLKSKLAPGVPLGGARTAEDPAKSKLEDIGKDEGWKNYSATPDDNGLGFNLKFGRGGVATPLKAKEKSDDKDQDREKSSLALEAKLKGNIRYNGALDFYTIYNPKVSPVTSSMKKNLINILNPLLFAGKTAITVGTMQRLKTLLYSELDYDLEVSLELSKELKGKYEIALCKFTSGFVLGVIPVSNETELVLEFEPRIAGSLSLNYEIKAENDIVTGFDLERDPNTLLMKEAKWYLKKDSRIDDKFYLKAEIELGLGVTLVLKNQTLLVGLLGPKIDPQVYIDGTLGIYASSASARPGWELDVDLGIKAAGSIDLSLFHWDKVEWKIARKEFVGFRWNLYHAPAGVIVLNGDKQTGPAGQQLPQDVQFQVVGSNGKALGIPLPIAVHLQPNSSGSVPQNIVVATNKPFTTPWTLGNTAGRQELQAFVQKSDGSKEEKVAIAQAMAGEPNQKPTAPTLLSPANAATGIALNTPLKWQASTDPENDPLTYTVLLGKTNPPTDTASKNQSGLTYTPTSQSNNTKYYWQVLAHDGKTTTSSTVRTYTTVAAAVPNRPPTQPTLSTPATAATSIALNTKLTWQASSDPDGDRLTYDVYLGKSNPPAKVRSDLTSLSYTPSGQTNSTKYYWQIIVKDSKTQTASDLRTYTTVVAPPARPTITSVSPLTVQANSTTTFTVIGTGLKSNFAIHIDDIVISEISANSAGTKLTFKGVANNEHGNQKNGVIKTTSDRSVNCATDTDNPICPLNATFHVNITAASSGSNPAGVQMITVTGGTFEMGCKSGRDDINSLSCDSDEKPLHSVTVSTFKLSKYEITNAQYVAFLNAKGVNSDGSFNDPTYGNVEYIDMDDSDVMITHNGSKFVVRSHSLDLSNYPVIEVSWYGANAYCKWAGGRLPTEAEWEFAARGGTSSRSYQYSGSNTVGDVAWYYSNSNSSGQSNWDNVRTHPVGTKAANELGFHDMSGNVWEWCADWYGAYSSASQTNPTGPSSGKYRVLRGGGWGYYARGTRVPYRDDNAPSDRYDGSGFRLFLFP